jgi:SynChlorMet cassette protein ScmD
MVQIITLPWHVDCTMSFYARYRCCSVWERYLRKDKVLASVKNGKRPIRNPFVVLREEFDDWAILFDLDTGHGFGLNPAGVYVWKLLNGQHPIGVLLEKIRTHAEGAPEEAGEHIGTFVDALVREGLAGYNLATFGPVDNLRNAVDRATLDLEKWFYSSPGVVSEAKPFTYEPPKLVDLSGKASVARGDCGNGSGDTGNCWNGGGPTFQCLSGNSASSYSCCTGTGPGWTSNCNPGNCAHRDVSCQPGGMLCQFGDGAGGTQCCQTGTSL